MPTSAPLSKPFQSGRSLRIAVVAFDGISPFHLAVPCMVFGEDRRELGVPRYQLSVCALESGSLRTSAGFSIDAGRGLTGLRGADVVVVPSWRDTNEPAPPRLLKAMQTAHSSGATIVGLCLGAFVLAEAGLLRGREATTHWHWAQRFAERFPEVRLNAKVLYVDAGQVLTSAGTAAGLDCCLHLLRRWCGAEVANRVARRLVVAPHRAGGQAQFIEHSLPATSQGDRMATTIDYAASHLDQPLTLDDLAERAAMSRRSFTRHFQQRTGSSVLQWLLHQRLAAASRLLEHSQRPIELIASDCGFGSGLSLRQHFVREMGVPPLVYRRQFQPKLGQQAGA